MPPPIDLTTLRSFIGGDAALEKELIRTFIAQSDINLETLRGNCLDGNNVVWVEAAHMFKGGAISAGAAALSKLCDQAQYMADVTAATRAELFDQIDREYAAVKTYLRGIGLW